MSFGWPGAPPLDGRSFVEVHRSDEPRLLLHETVPAAAGWRDEDPAGAELLFYRFFNATACGERLD